MALLVSRPFPLIRNKTLNIAALLRKKNGEEDDELDFAMVQVPSVIPRIVELPEEKDEEGNPQRVVILLEEIIERNMPSLFLNYDIIASQPFRVMRNADLTIDEEEAVDLLEGIAQLGEVICVDLVEVSPPYDDAAGTTCYLAARILADFLGFITKERERRGER